MRSKPGPVWVGEVELGRSLDPTGAMRALRAGDTAARLLVRLHGQVLGFVTIPVSGDDIASGIDAVMVGAAVRSQLGARLARHVAADGHGPDAEPGHPGISVVVCTRDRPLMLAACLERLRALDYEPFEVVVVDNAPSSDASRACFERTVGGDARFRYVREPVAGLSRARNRGMAEASARLVAFTDDDVQVDARWLQAIAAGFSRDARTACVTGIVPPAALDHPAQQYFDRRYSWARRVDAEVYSISSGGGGVPALYPYSAGLFGTGANFAVDREVVDRLGGFDPALGAGSPSGGGEELDLFVRILRAGWSVVYEPSAVVWHVHRGDARALRHQLFAYGEGLTAFLTKHLVDTCTTKEVLKRIPEGARHILRMWSPAAMDGRAPAVLVLTEALGMVAGPLAYARGRGRAWLARAA